MKIYITGNRGFIAGHLTAELEAHGHTVVGGDLPEVDYLGDGLEHIKAEKPDVVVHAAAQVGRVFGEDNVRFTIESNALMTTRVAKVCNEIGARLTYISTSEVYGDQGDTSCYEGGPCVTPHNLYGLSKRWAEEACALYCPNGLQVIRLSMPYGPGLPAGRGRAAIINFLYNALHDLPIPVHRDSERAWCWIGDTVRGFRLVIEKAEVARTAADYERGDGVYNIGRFDNPVSMRAVAVIACGLCNRDDSIIQMVDAPANQTKVKRLSNLKLRELGWEPGVELLEGMATTLEYVKTLA